MLCMLKSYHDLHVKIISKSPFQNHLKSPCDIDSGLLKTCHIEILYYFLVLVPFCKHHHLKIPFESSIGKFHWKIPFQNTIWKFHVELIHFSKSCATQRFHHLGRCAQSLRVCMCMSFLFGWEEQWFSFSKCVYNIYSLRMCV